MRDKIHLTEGVKETIKNGLRKDNDTGANRKVKERHACGMLHGVPQGWRSSLWTPCAPPPGWPARNASFLLAAGCRAAPFLLVASSQPGRRVWHCRSFRRWWSAQPPSPSPAWVHFPSTIVHWSREDHWYRRRCRRGRPMGGVERAGGGSAAAVVRNPSCPKQKWS